MSEKKCPKCNGSTEAGILVSFTDVRWGKSMRQWRPPKVVAYKCEKCGYIELYVK